MIPQFVGSLGHEREHRRRCFLCHAFLEETALVDLCAWHYLLFGWRLLWFLLRTGQVRRWKP